MQNYTNWQEKTKQLIGWKEFSLFIYLPCSFKSWFLTIAMRVIWLYNKADPLCYKMIYIYHIYYFSSGLLLRKKTLKFVKTINYICIVIIIKMASFPWALDLLSVLIYIRFSPQSYLSTGARHRAQCGYEPVAPGSWKWQRLCPSSHCRVQQTIHYLHENIR